MSILVVDDNSPDETGHPADEFAAASAGRVNLLHRPGKPGLSSASVQGFHYIRGKGADAIAQMDADFSHDPATLIEMIKKLETCDVVFGSKGFIFQVEMAYLAHCLEYHMKETPIYFNEWRRGKSKMSFGIQVEAVIGACLSPHFKIIAHHCRSGRERRDPVRAFEGGFAIPPEDYGGVIFTNPLFLR